MFLNCKFTACTTVAYRCPCRCMYMYDTLDIRTCSIDGRVESETGLVDSKVGAATVYHFTLEINLHLDGIADCIRLYNPVLKT